MTATSYGQTAKIAKFLQTELEAAGMHVQRLSPSDKLTDVDAVIIGCPVYIGKFAPEVIEWTRSNLAKLNAISTGFFSVSLNAADARPKARKADDELLAGFLTQTGVAARYIASFAGMIHYTKYGWFKRWMMKRICASAGGPTDTTKDHELTDWPQVAAFAQAFIAQEATSPFATEHRLRARRATSVKPIPLVR